MHTFSGPEEFRPLAFSADDRYLARGMFGSDVGRRPSISVWDVAASKEVARIPVEREITDAAFLPASTSLVMFGIPPGELTVWDFQSGAARTLAANPVQSGTVARLQAPCVSSDGTLVAFAAPLAGKNTIRVRQLADEQLVAEFTIGEETVTQTAFSRNGASLLVEGHRFDNRKKQYQVHVYKYDLRGRGKPNKWGPFPMTGVRKSMKFGFHRLSADGRMLATTLLGNGVLLIDVPTKQNQQVGPHPVNANIRTTAPDLLHPGGVAGTCIFALAFTPDGSTLATGAWGSGTVLFWPVAGSASEKQLVQPEMVAVTRLVFSDSGRLLAVDGFRDVPSCQLLVHVWRLASK